MPIEGDNKNIVGAGIYGKITLEFRIEDTILIFLKLRYYRSYNKNERQFFLLIRFFYRWLTG